MQNITIGYNGAEVEFYPEYDEYVCLDCQTVVDDENGHERAECFEASRQRAEDAAADYRD